VRKVKVIKCVCGGRQYREMPKVQLVYGGISGVEAVEDVPDYRCLKCGCDYDYSATVEMGEEQYLYDD
jgi:hypothetical protein